MTQRVTPMIHVPDVHKAVAWYQGIGFQLIGTGDDGEEMVWAELSFGAGRVMFSAGGKAGNGARRDMDLYIHTGNVDAVFGSLKDRVTVQETPHDTFYGMREFIIRDLYGFWITFGEPVAA